MAVMLTGVQITKCALKMHTLSSAFKTRIAKCQKWHEEKLRQAP